VIILQRVKTLLLSTFNEPAKKGEGERFSEFGVFFCDDISFDITEMPKCPT
jgi:hypothetical protein